MPLVKVKEEVLYQVEVDLFEVTFEEVGAVDRVTLVALLEAALSPALLKA